MDIRDRLHPRSRSFCPRYPRVGIIAAFAASLLSAPAWSQDTAPRRTTVQEPIALSLEIYRLPNGLNVILAPDPAVPIVAVNLWYHVGSANEPAGKTGFAHLFEHLMFQGSENVGNDAHFRYVQEAGGTLNGTTSPDRTNYFEAVPSNFLEMALWLESDRMGFLLPALTQEKLDNQRDVVMNERRQSYENVPYGLAMETILAALYPEGHPYRHPTIGSMDDLLAGSLEDAQDFFERYYAPANASLSIVGDFDPEEAKRLVSTYFGTFPAAPAVERPTAPPVSLTSPNYLLLEDRVQLPRLYIVWPTPPFFEPGDAEMDAVGYVLAGGRTSRLYRRLVYEEQLAQSVAAQQGSLMLGSRFQIVVQPQPGVTLEQVEAIVEEELDRLKREGPTQRELQQAVNNIEASYVRAMELRANIADRLNGYHFWTGDAAYFEEDLARYRALTPRSVQEAAARYLGDGRVVLNVVPEGQSQLQATP